jgi:cystathionine beta-lyase
MDFDRVIDRRHTGSAKWESYGDALPLWTADMDFRAPEPVIQALRERVDHGIFGYTFPPADLVEAVQAWLWERHGWQVEGDAISFLPGVMRGVNLVARAVGEPGDGILIQPPVYFPFLEVAANSDRAHQQAEIPQVEGRYQVDYDAFEEAITDRTCLFLLCNPHNPIGRAFTPAELEHMAQICLEHGVVICSDEIHGDLVFSGHQHTPIASLAPEIAQQTVTCFAPSKTFNIPGLTFSVMVVQNQELKKRMDAVGAGLVRGSNMMGYTAARAAYREGGEWLDQLLAYLEANRDYVCDFVRTRLPDVRVTKPEATYLAWLDCSDAGLPKGQTPHQFFLNQARVALNDGATFGSGGEGFVRLNFGCPRTTLTEALERMERALRAARSHSSEKEASND